MMMPLHRDLTRRRLLLCGLALLAAGAAAGPAFAQAKTVAKHGRFLYRNDLIDIQLTVHTLDHSDNGAAIEPEVAGSLKGSVLRVQGRLERGGMGDSFRVLRLQHADGTWHEVDIWVPLRL